MNPLGYPLARQRFTSNVSGNEGKKLEEFDIEREKEKAKMDGSSIR